MGEFTQSPTHADPIDWFEQELKQRPHHADDLKRELRRRMGLAETPARFPPAPDNSDAEDLWDNVPV